MNHAFLHRPEPGVAVPAGQVLAVEQADISLFIARIGKGAVVQAFRSLGIRADFSDI